MQDESTAKPPDSSRRPKTNLVVSDGPASPALPSPKRWWWGAPSEDPLDEWVSEKLAEQFRRSLFIDFKSLTPPDPSNVQNTELFERGLQMLEEEGFTWQNGYEAQQIKVRLVSDDQLHVELIRAMKFAQSLKVDTTDLAHLLTPLDADATDEEVATRHSQLRSHLAYLVSDIQWAEQKKFARRKLRARYVKSVCMTTWVVGLMFFVALAWTVLMSQDGFRSGLFGTLPFVGENSPDLFRYPGLLLAIASGVLGAWFSMLVSIDKRLSGLTLDELRVAQKVTSLWARLIFGGAAAVIFYFLLRSEMIDGSVLPDLNGIGFVKPELIDETRPSGNERISSGETKVKGIANFIPSIQMCLLIVWCVIVGFSEKMIPAALTKNAEKVSETGGA